MNQEPAISQHELRSPASVDLAGIPLSMIEDILLRTTIAEGRPSMVRVAERLHCGVGVIESVVSSLRDRRLMEYEGMQGRTYLLSVTEAGRAHSRQRSAECRYAGPLPVPLDLYQRVVRAQRPNVHLDRDQLTHAFSDLVISPGLIDQLGPAICGDGAIFLYGPPGTGKSSIAERLIRAYRDTVLVPHCVEVQGQIISVFDPILHEPVENQPAELDPRWVMCHRPAVIAGGELHAGMLDLTLDREVGTFLAPLQFKANNGILVIDDFGRQAMTPEELLNRWIVPLDRQVDYLTLGGRKFQVPFEVKVVLSTNLDPTALGDEAFFRRIHNKVYIGCLDDQQFDWVLARVAQAKQIEVTEDAAARLRSAARAQGDGELRAYLPGVVCKLAVAICRYENAAVRLTPALVDRVLELYFAKTVAVGTPTGSSATGAAPQDGPSSLEFEAARLAADQASETASSTSILAAR
jgi:hypothetical protein